MSHLLLILLLELVTLSHPYVLLVVGLLLKLVFIGSVERWSLKLLILINILLEVLVSCCRLISLHLIIHLLLTINVVLLFFLHHLVHHSIHLHIL